MIYKQIQIDLWRKLLEPINVVQYEDSGRTIRFTITDGAKPVDLTGFNVTFYAMKPDGNMVFNNCTIVDAVKGVVDYVVTGQTVLADGKLACWLNIMKEGQTINSIRFEISVQQCSDFTTAVESTSEFGALEDAISQVADALKQVDIADNLTTDDPTKVLSAAQGKILRDMIYPVGSIYLSVNAVNPSVLFGGTWEEWGEGRSPVGVDVMQAEFNTVEKTGGEKTHLLTARESGIRNHDHPDTTPKYPDVTVQSGTGNVGMWGGGATNRSGWSGEYDALDSHNNLQPYITCYMWKRTA